MFEAAYSSSVFSNSDHDNSPKRYIAAAFAMWHNQRLTASLFLRFKEYLVAR
ncbi:hypothetical protein C8Q70DRAFT_346083 [Cubamyces menziesii]|nr:hypothetical protein C8Q70DRAFT_346083 [Cubamyces menziesii]